MAVDEGQEEKIEKPLEKKRQTSPVSTYFKVGAFSSGELERASENLFMPPRWGEPPEKRA
ncbi:hypothetical protein KKI19_02805 [Patescibacteria group bacterium]|nr:hypothetical protein [Patescibacteria group bacterium]